MITGRCPPRVFVVFGEDGGVGCDCIVGREAGTDGEVGMILE
jgi:hypothetical protein